MGDIISRQDATTIPILPKEHRKYQTMNIDDAYDLGWLDCQNCIEKLPPAQPEIVRCGECKHRDKRYLCEVWDAYITNDEYYCGNAERREE